MNNALAGPKAIATGAVQSAMLAGHTFRVSEFELKEPPFTKRAKILTSLCKGQLVSFVFVSNSAARVRVMEESLKTLDFSNQ